MGRYTIETARQLRDLEAALGSVTESTTSTLEWIAVQVRSLLDTEKALTISYEPQGERLAVIPGAVVGIPREIYAFLDRWLVRAPVQWAAYNPLRPEPSQRNVVMRMGDLTRLSDVEIPPVVAEVFPRFGLSGDDMLRVVVTDGASLLGYVSVFQSTPFEKQQQRLLTRIVPALRRRLSSERLMTMAGSTQLLLDAAMAQIAAATFIVAEGGSVLEANRVGRLWLARNGLEGRRSLRDAVVSPDRATSRSFHVTKVMSAGVATRYLIVETRTPGSLDGVRSAGLRWGFTSREVEVLVALAEGMPTRTIAAHLGVAERTVESHLTSMFEKAQVETRAEVVAKAMRVM